MNGKKIIAFSAMFVIGSLFFSLLPPAIDWHYHFRPAARNLADLYQGSNYNPPWLYVILWPLAALPESLGRGALAFLTVWICFEYLERSLSKILLLILSPAFLAVLVQGQIDAIILLALMGPEWSSLALLAIKPQGAFLCALRRLNVLSLAVLGTLLAGSVLIWGLWFTGLGSPRAAWFNLSLFPWSVPVGLIVLYLLSCRPDLRQSDALLCLASLCFAPYFAAQSLLPSTAAAIRETKGIKLPALVVVLSWLYVLVVRF